MPWCDVQRRYAAPLAAAVLALSLATSLRSTPARAAGPAPEVSAAASSTELTYAGTISISGRVTEAAQGIAGEAVSLEADPYPFHGFLAVARSSTAADGSFAFTGIRADRNTRLRVVLDSAAATGPAIVTSPVLPIFVDPSVALNLRTLGPGRSQISVRLAHTVHAGASSSVDAAWFVAARGTRVFRLVAVTPTRELSPGLTYASTIIDPPARHFVYRVCLNPTWEAAMGRAAAHGRCPRDDYRVPHDVGYGGEGRGIPLAPYPSAGAIAAAGRYLAGRAGRTSFAVVDSTGRLSGLNLREHFETASVVKVMMLVAFLQMRSAQDRGLDEADRALLYPMIHISDNEAASAVYGIVGEGAVARVARESGMSDYAPGIGWWAYTQTSAADQARFLFALPRLIPAQFYAYARGLLAGIEPSQSWGVPPVARPRWQVFFKTGALPEEGLFNEVARLERPGVTFTLAVFTDGDPSMSYGEQTIEGVAATLLAHSG